MPLEHHNDRTMTLAWRPIITMVLCAVAGALLGLFFAQRTPYEFRVEAEVLVMVGRETSRVRSEVLAAGGPKGSTRGPDFQFMTGEIMLLRSPWVLRETVESLARDVPGFHEMTLAGSGGGVLSGLASAATSIAHAIDLTHDPSEVERSITEWGNRLEVNPSIRTDVIEVAVLVSDVKLGEAFLERLLQKYEEAHVSMHTQAITELTLAHELEGLREREVDAEAALRNFNLRTGIIDYNKTFGHVVTRRLGAETRLRTLAVDQAAAAASEETVVKLLEGIPERSVGKTMTRPDPTTDFIKNQIVQARQAEGEVARQMLDPRAVERARERTAVARGLLEGRSEVRESASVVEDRDPVHTMLSRRRVDSEIEAEVDAVERAELQKKLQDLHGRELELEGLRAEFTGLVDDLHEVRGELGEAQLADQVARFSGVLEDAGLLNVRIIAPPKAQIRPERVLGRDQRVGVTMGCAAAGFLLSVLFYAVRSAVRDELLASRTGIGSEEDRSP